MGIFMGELLVYQRVKEIRSQHDRTTILWPKLGDSVASNGEKDDQKHLAPSSEKNRGIWASYIFTYIYIPWASNHH